MRILVCPYALTKETVQRTWRERLFSWPWRPWRGTKEIEVPGMYMLSIPLNYDLLGKANSRSVYEMVKVIPVLNEPVLVVHPSLWRAVQATLEGVERQ